MTTLLILNTGQSDVQLVADGIRFDFSKKCCGELHDELEKRGFTVVESRSATKKNDKPIEAFPDGDLAICTPKLDAVLNDFDASPPTTAIVFETSRSFSSDPRLAGTIFEQRLSERGIKARRHVFLKDKERIEDASNDFDAVIRQAVVSGLSKTIADAVEEIAPDHIVVATTGGIPAANDVIRELARLHAVGRAEVASLEVPDGSFAGNDDRAVEEKFQPAAGYRARWHALSLVEKGNLLGAWGAVSHLENVQGQEWTQVVKWLSQFASSLPFDPPLPADSDLLILNHRRMAVRSALRVELALRAGDIPRAIHGTVSFFESALWDQMNERCVRHSTKDRLFKLSPPPTVDLIRECDPKILASFSRSKQDDQRKKPFIFKEETPDGKWYSIDDSKICAIRLAEHYLKNEPLKRLAQAISENIRNLRNDIAHNEPTPNLMKEAQMRMREAILWSVDDRFLDQPLVQDVLTELGVPSPEQLHRDLIATVHEHLLAIP